VVSTLRTAARRLGPQSIDSAPRHRRDAVLSGEQVAVEKPFEIRKVDTVILQVHAALPLVPGIHTLNVNAKRICFK
jgi:hypothetical protein